ncbi:hypothetical protein [Pseudonocardia humida]|uniref:Uncharacterized protein n=1 Tax=Pseudonocardia humida TaxID=2800819 RepID=A0ABT0ZTT4_9PSEU|nr:hypothetical protein [Pseudonocardia humida]MCO1654145.1 hypothetical protein [Pseudonocardia humida]
MAARTGVVADHGERVVGLERGVDGRGVVLHAAAETGRGRLTRPRYEPLVPQERDARGAVGRAEVVQGEVETEVDDPDDGPLPGQGGARRLRGAQPVGPGLRHRARQQRPQQPRGLHELHLRLVGQRLQLGDRQLHGVDALGHGRPGGARRTGQRRPVGPHQHPRRRRPAGRQGTVAGDDLRGREIVQPRGLVLGVHEPAQPRVESGVERTGHGASS